MYFNRVFPKVFIGTGAIQTTGPIATPTSVLPAGTIALVDYKTNTAIALAAANRTAHPLAYLACGSYHTTDKIGPFHGGYKESDKTKGINPNYVTKYWVSSPTPAQAHILRVGWDGTSDCSAPAFEKDTTYWLRVEIKGSPVYRTLNRNFYKTYAVHTGCSTTCAEICVDSASAKLVMESYRDQINNDPIMSKFIRAEVGSDTAALPAGNVPYNVYTLTVQDNGTETALAAVQTAYPTLVTTLTRLSYTGITSVYQVIKTGAAPAAFNGTAWVDAGYDVYKVPQQYCIYVDKTDAGVSRLTEVQAAYAAYPYLVAGSIAVEGTTGDCTEIIHMSVYNSDFVSAGCDYYSQATFAPIPAFDGRVWETCPCITPDEDLTGKYFLQLTGAYTDTDFNNCSFDLFDLFELAPVEIEAQFVDEVNDVCKFETIPVKTVRFPRQATGTGEELLREFIVYSAYKQEPWTCDPRMREVFDYQALNVVDRKAQYKKYYIVHSVPRFQNPTGTFDNDQYLITLAFKAGTDTSALEAILTSYIASGVNAVPLEVK